MTADREHALRTIRMTLAASYSCDEHDFDCNELTVVATGSHPARLRFPMRTKGLQIVTMGAGVVVSCHPDRMEWIRSALDGQTRDAIFSASTLAQLSSFVARDQQYLDGPGLRFACSRDRLRPAATPSGVTIAVAGEEQIAALYRQPGFENALAYRIDTERPDMVATVASRAQQIIGIAAASADSDELWQIGVDVIESERRAGIGRALVSQVTSLVLDQGKIPYYSAAVSNIASRSLAIGLGYWPAWTEVFVRDAVANETFAGGNTLRR